MDILKIISPASNSYPTIENFDSKKEFSKMSTLHKAITLVATGAIAVVTLGFKAASYFHTVVGRFRKLELDQEAPAASSAIKVNNIADFGTHTIPVVKDDKPQTRTVPDKPLPPPPRQARQVPDKPLPPRPDVKDTSPLPSLAPKAPPKKPLPPPPAVQAAPKQAVQQPESDFRKVSKEFWDDHKGNGTLHRFWEMMAANDEGGDHQTAAEIVVDHYIGIKQNQGSFALSDPHRKALINSVRDRLVKNVHPPHVPSAPKVASNGQYQADVNNVVALPDGRQLIVYSTSGDGSCAIHALLGKPNENAQYKTDATKYRKDLADWMEEKQRNKQLPNTLQKLLEDYFVNFDLSTPASFKSAVQSQYDQYRKEFDSIAPKNAPGKAGPPMTPEQIEKREAIINNFINDPVVFNAYLAEVRNTNRYLLMEEVELAADCFKKHLILYQPYPNSSDLGIQEFNTSASGEPVRVWYNGGNHYEHAEVMA